MKINIEKLEDFLEEIKPLLRDHYEEVFPYQEHIELNPDYERYYQLEKEGKLLSVIVREDSGLVIGYFLTFVTTSPHYSSNLFASNDIIYLDPSYRGSSLGYEMISFARDRLREMGVSVLSINMKTAKPFEGLCQALNMDRQEIVYTEYIG